MKNCYPYNMNSNMNCGMNCNINGTPSRDCNCNMNRTPAHDMDCGTSRNVACNTDCKPGRNEHMTKSLAMAYVPIQRFGTLYDPMKALHCGTAFPELNLIFCGRRGR